MVQQLFQGQKFLESRPIVFLILLLHQVAKSHSILTYIIFEASFFCILFCSLHFMIISLFLLSYETWNFFPTSQPYYTFLFISSTIHSSFLKWRYALDKNVMKIADKHLGKCSTLTAIGILILSCPPSSSQASKWLKCDPPLSGVFTTALFIQQILMEHLKYATDYLSIRSKMGAKSLKNHFTKFNIHS